MKKLISLILILIFFNINAFTLFAEESSSVELPTQEEKDEAEEAAAKKEEFDEAMEPVWEQLYETGVESVIAVIEKAALGELSNGKSWGGSALGILLHFLVNTAKRSVNYYDTYDVGVHVYIDSNEIIDPAKNSSKYAEITQIDKRKTSIGIYVEDLTEKNDASNSYVYNTSVVAASLALSGYGYLHSNSGAAESSDVGGVMNSTFMAFAYDGDAVGIYTEEGTTFTGGDVVTEAKDEISLGVSYNDILAADALWSVKYTDWGIYSDTAAGNSNTYGIFADGDWSAIDILYNTIESYAYYGDSVGLKVISSTFSENIIGNDIIASSYDGLAIGIYFDLSSESLANVEATVSWNIFFPGRDTLIGADDDYEKYEVTIDVDSGTLCIAALSGLIQAATETEESVYATIYATHTNGEDSSIFSTEEDTSSATGILFTGGSYVVNSISDYDITAITTGSGAFGIAFDYSEEDTSIIVAYLDSLNITVYSASGFAAGIFLDTNSYNDEGGVSGVNYADNFIHLISNLDISVSAKGNVYGYALGDVFGYNDEDGGFALYNSAYGSSINVAENIDYSSISLTVNSLGVSDTSLTGNAAYGMYLYSTDYRLMELSLNYTDISADLTDDEIIAALSVLDITATAEELLDLEIVISNVDLNALTGDLSITIGDDTYTSTGFDISDSDVDYYLDLSFKRIEVSAAGYAYGIYLDDSHLGSAIKTELVINTMGPENYGVYMINGSTLEGLTSSISFNSVNDIGTVYMTAVEIDSTSCITEISSDISFDLTYLGDFVIKGISVGAESSLGSFSGSFSTSTTDNSILYVTENFYGYLIGKQLASDESLLLYNDYLKTSEGITIDSSISITLDNISTADETKWNVYGAYVTSADSNIDIEFDISVEEAVGIGVYDGASVTLIDNVISAKYNYVDGTNTTLIITESALLQGYTSISNGATLYIEGDVSFIDSTIEINSNSTLYFSEDSTISLDASSDIIFDTGALVSIDLSDIDSIVNYTIITTENASNYSDMLNYLNNGSVSVVLSDTYDTDDYNYATYGDNTGDMEVSYEAVFTGDGSTAINVNIVAIGEFDYFKWVEDENGNISASITTDASESDFSAYAATNARIENTGNDGDDVNYSFLSINYYEEEWDTFLWGGAIYNEGTIGNINGDFIANQLSNEISYYFYAYGGAIYNEGTIGDINGDFVANNIYMDSNVYGGAIYNTGTIGDITGDFINNYIIRAEGGMSADIWGGAIYNRGTIGVITGDFIGNYVYSDKSSKGGAIYAYSSVYDSGEFAIGGIIGDFIGNYVYTSTSSFINGSYGGAIYTSYSDGSFDTEAEPSTIAYIIGDFTGNYAYSLTGEAYGGAIYNKALIYNADDEGGFYIESIEGNFTDNYAYSSTGEAKGGAIYNELDATSDYEGMGAYIELVAKDTSNYLNIGNWASTDGIIDENDDINGGFLYNTAYLCFNIDESSSITIGDGRAGYDSIAGTGTIRKTGEGTLTVNSSMQYFTGILEVQEGTFSLSSNIGASVTVSDGAIFNISNSDYYDSVTMYSTSSLTINDGAVLLFDAYASLYISSQASITFDEGSLFSIDFSGVYEAFEYTLFEVENADTYAYIKDFLSTTDEDDNLVNIDVSSAYTLISSLEENISSVQFGDSIADIEYSFTLNYDDTAQTIDIELSLNGEFVYFAWGVDANGNITLSEVDKASDNDLITYSLANARIENFSGEIANSFLGLSATNGGAIYNYNSTDSTDIEIISITGDFVGNSSSARGGAIYNYTHNADGISNNISIGDITGDFIANAVYDSTSFARGGAIYSYAVESSSITMGTITGDFINNYTYSSKATESYTSKGGAIYNYAEAGTSGDETEIYIESIVGDFLGNYVYSVDDSAVGGAISNETHSDSSITIDNITASFIGNYVYSGNTSDSHYARGGAIYNYANGGVISINISTDEEDIYFTGNYVNKAGTITSNAIYNAAINSGVSTVNFTTSDSNSIIINDGISGGTNISGQILNIAGTVEFNNSVQYQSINVNSGTLTLGSYEGTSDLYGDGSNIEVISAIASLSGSVLSVDSGASLNITATGIEISDTTITLADNSTLSFDVYSSLILDESSTISLGSNVELELNMNGETGEFDYTILTIAKDSYYSEALAYLESLYLTVDIGVAIADYGDEFYNVEVSGDGENIDISTYLAGEISYFEWTYLGGVGNIILVELDAENYLSADISAYSASNNRIIGSEYFDSVADVDLQTSFVGLSQYEEKNFAQGGAVFNDSSTVAISIGELEGDFIGNTASSSASYAQGGAWYNYASNNDITIANLISNFLGNSAFSTGSYAQGGAFYNYADSASIEYSLIISNFYVNYAYTSDSEIEDGAAQGGAIYNYVANDGDASISIKGIRGDFDGNYAYTVYANAMGGAIYNESYTSLNIGYIVSDFYTNYATANDDGVALGGAIYNYVDGVGSINIGYITGDFLGNYTYSALGEAQGGAIYNYAESGSIDMTLLISFGDMEMTGNYVNNAGVISSNAIYNGASEDGTSTVYLLASEGATLTINDGISGSENLENQILSINATDYGDDVDTEYTGTISLNNAVENQTINVYNGTLSLGGYDGTDDLYDNADNLFSEDDRDNVSVDSSIASLDNVVLTLSDRASLLISTNSDGDVVSVSNSIITFESGSTWSFDDCADIYLDDYSLENLSLASDQVVEFSSLSTSELTLSSALEFLLEKAATINHIGEGSLTINADLHESTEFNLINGTLNFGGAILAGTLNISEGTDFNIIVNADNKNSSNILTGALTYDSEDNLEIDILIADIFEILDSETVIYDTADYDNIDLVLDTVFDDSYVYLSGTTLNVATSVTATQDDGNATFSIESDANTITVSGAYSVGEGESYNIDVINNDNGTLSLDGGEISLNADAELILGGDDADIIAINGTLNATKTGSQISIAGDIEVGDLTISGNLYGDDVAISGSSLVLVDVNLTGSIALENIALSGELGYDIATGEEAVLLTVSEDNATISSELYVTNDGEGELTVYEVTSSTGDVTFEDGAVISLTGNGYALANDHDFTGNNGITAILEGSATIIGDIKVESPFTVTAYSYTGTDGETYTVEDAKLTLKNGTLETGDNNESNSDDVTVISATLALQNYTIDTAGGDINLVGGSLVIDSTSSLVSVGTINMTTDTAANMSTLELSTGADIGNATVTIVGSASMLKNSTYEDTITADNISALTIYNKYGDFDVDTSGTLSVDSLTYFQETKAGNANEMALAFALDELEDIGDDYDSAYKIAFKLALDEAGLDSAIMNSYSNIAEVNTMLLSNLNFANVNRARSILDKNAGAYISEEEIIEEATGVALEAQEVAVIKYTKLAQLQSINLLGSKDGVGGVAGYDYWSVGSLANMDNILSENALVGVSIGGTYNKTEGDNGDVASSTTFLLNAYGVVKSGIYPFEIFANIGYAHFWNEAGKNGFNSKWDSDAFNLLGGIAFDFETSIENLNLKPLAILNMAMLNSESASYSDTIEIDSQSYISAKLMLGFEVEYAISAQFNAIIRAMYAHEFGDESYDFSYGFSNGFAGDIDYVGSQAGRDAAIMGFSLSYDFSETCTAYFDYNAYLYESLTTHTLNLSIALKF